MIIRKHFKEHKWEIFLTAQSIKDCEFIYNFTKELARLQPHYSFSQEIIYSCEGDTYCFRLSFLPRDREALLREIENLLQGVSDADNRI